MRARTAEIEIMATLRRETSVSCKSACITSDVRIAIVPAGQIAFFKVSIIDELIGGIHFDQ